MAIIVCSHEHWLTVSFVLRLGKQKPLADPVLRQNKGYMYCLSAEVLRNLIMK